MVESLWLEKLGLKGWRNSFMGNFFICWKNAWGGINSWAESLWSEKWKSVRGGVVWGEDVNFGRKRVSPPGEEFLGRRLWLFCEF